MEPKIPALEVRRLRTIYAILGSYIAARLAPHSPMRHALILGAIGLVLSLAAGAIKAYVTSRAAGARRPTLSKKERESQPER